VRPSLRRAAPAALVLALAGCMGPMRGSGRGPMATPVDREVIRVMPNRPYSQAVRVGNTYYFAGKIGVTDSTRALATAG